MITPRDISVIIPTFNRKELLPRALESVLNQQVQAGEILVVDDGSTDGTADMVKNCYPEVRLIQQPHQGVSAARNRGIREAKGDWLAFLDSDDAWLPDKLKEQIAALQQNPGYKICHTDEIWIRRGRRVNPMKKHRKYGGYIFRQCLPLCILSPSSVLLHRSIFEEVGLFDEQLPACEDYDLWLRVCAIHPVLFIDKPLIVKYGGHADQLSRQFWGMDRFRIYALEKILTSPRLSREDRQAALQMLLQKIEIYLKGAAKRQKIEEMRFYQKKLVKYQNELEKLLAQKERVSCQ